MVVGIIIGCWDCCSLLGLLVIGIVVERCILAESLQNVFINKMVRPSVGKVKGVQTYVAMVFLLLCTARRARVLLASKANFEQVFMSLTTRGFSVLGNRAYST